MSIARAFQLFITIAVITMWPEPQAGAAPEDFILTTQSLMISERGLVDSVVIMTPTNNFTFLPPAGWHYTPNALERKVTLQPPHEYGVTVTMRINPEYTNLPPDAISGKGEGLVEHVRTRFPGAKVVRQFVCHTAGLNGQAVDAEWPVNATNRVSLRLAFVPVKDGMVEFDLSTVPEKFAKQHLMFANLLTSFRVESTRRKR